MTIHMLEHDHGCFAQLIVNPQSVEFLGLELVLHTLYVPQQYRGLGHGRELLNRSIEFAGDRTLALAPVPDQDCPIDVVAWYGRHDFIFTNSGGMMERKQRDMPYAELACSVCGAPGGEPCRNLRTGEPIKYLHKDGRVIRVATRSPQDVLETMKAARP